MWCPFCCILLVEQDLLRGRPDSRGRDPSSRQKESQRACLCVLTPPPHARKHRARYQAQTDAGLTLGVETGPCPREAKGQVDVPRAAQLVRVRRPGLSLVSSAWRESGFTALFLQGWVLNQGPF